MDSIVLLLSLILSAVPLCTADSGQEAVNYAYMISGGDIDFVGTIAQESMFDPNAIGDKGLAYGFCQYRKDYNKWGYDTYKSLGTWQEQLEMCYKSYTVWESKGQLGNRLYGYNLRSTGLKKLNITCSQ